MFVEFQGSPRRASHFQGSPRRASQLSVAAVLGSSRGSCRLQDGLLGSKRAKISKITSELRTVLHADTPRSHPLSRHNGRSLLGLLPPTGAGLQRWLEWDPGLDPGSVDATEHRDGSVFLLEPLALTGFKDVCVSGGGDPVLAMTEIGYRSEILFNARLRRDSPRSVPTLELLQPFGPSAVGARLGVPCRLGRRLC